MVSWCTNGHAVGTGGEIWVKGTEFANPMRALAAMAVEPSRFVDAPHNHDSRGNHSMDILIQPLLQNAKRFSSSLHIRYSERKGQPVETSGSGGNGKEKEVALPGKSGEIRKTSYVIIHKPYDFLEPLVRSMFEEAEDVKVIVDRRFQERRRVSASSRISNRRKRRDRRLAVPMLDILINVYT